MFESAMAHGNDRLLGYQAGRGEERDEFIELFRDARSLLEAQ